MSNSSRRQFISAATKTVVTAGVILPGFKSTSMGAEKGLFVHHVFFWLKNPGSKEDLQQLLKGLQELSRIPYIKMFHIGQPADTNRDVIDASYQVSWLLLFNNKEEEQRYQQDPVHQRFVNECSHLWSKVQVYDSIDA